MGELSRQSYREEWTWRDKLVYWLTGRVSARIYFQRIAALAADEDERRRRRG